MSSAHSEYGICPKNKTKYFFPSVSEPTKVVNIPIPTGGGGNIINKELEYKLEKFPIGYDYFSKEIYFRQMRAAVAVCNVELIKDLKNGISNASTSNEFGINREDYLKCLYERAMRRALFNLRKIVEDVKWGGRIWSVLDGVYEKMDAHFAEAAKDLFNLATLGFAGPAQAAIKSKSVIEATKRGIELRKVQKMMAPYAYARNQGGSYKWVAKLPRNRSASYEYNKEITKIANRFSNKSETVWQKRLIEAAQHDMKMYGKSQISTQFNFRGKRYYLGISNTIPGLNMDTAIDLGQGAALKGYDVAQKMSGSSHKSQVKASYESEVSPDWRPPGEYKPGVIDNIADWAGEHTPLEAGKYAVHALDVATNMFPPVALVKSLASFGYHSVNYINEGIKARKKLEDKIKIANYERAIQNHIKEGLLNDIPNFGNCYFINLLYNFAEEDYDILWDEIFPVPFFYPNGIRFFTKDFFVGYYLNRLDPNRNAKHFANVLKNSWLPTFRIGSNRF